MIQRGNEIHWGSGALGAMSAAVVLSSFLLVMVVQKKRQNESQPAIMDVLSDFVFIGNRVAESTMVMAKWSMNRARSPPPSWVHRDFEKEY